jgi:outer membrane protein assembly factor BamC
MMDRFTRSSGVAAVCAALVSGCSWTGNFFSSDKVAYETAQQSKSPLEVPPDLSQLPRDDRFVVPERPQTITASGQQAARPAAGAAPAAGGGSAVVPTGVVAKIERQGNQRWLAVNLPPERVWPVLVDFWPTVGLKIEKSEPAAGIIETAWAENRAKLPQDIIRRTLGRVFDSAYSTGEMDKYRARVERTAQNTSEIFVSHRGMIEVYTTAGQDSTKWQPRPSDPELEAEILQRLLVQFDASAAKPTTTAAATAGAPTSPATPAAAGAAAATPAPTPQQARVAKGADGRSERLDIDDSFDRAWRRVGLALDRGAFTVEDRDRAKGIYFVRYLDPDYEAKAKADRGWLTKVFSSDKPIPAPQYRVVLTGQSTNQTVVTVQGADGKPERSAAGDRILALLNEQLR